MGQKVSPVGLRLGINRTWDSRWYAGKGEYGKLMHEDMAIREELMKQLKQAAVSKIVIERPHKKCRVTIHSARPGVVIGKKGADIEKLRRKVAQLTNSDVVLNIIEIRKPELDAQLIADSIAQQLEKRIMFRRAMKRAMQNAMRLGAQGIKIMSSGRLNGAEIARTEWYREGRVPLHTLRADIDYGVSEAKTTYGVIGIKVWVFKGVVLGRNEQPTAEPAAEEPRKLRRPGRPAGKPEGDEGKPAGRRPAPRKTAEKAAEDVKPEVPQAAPEVPAAKAPVKRVRKTTAVKPEGGAKEGKE